MDTLLLDNLDQVKDKYFTERKMAAKYNVKKANESKPPPTNELLVVLMLKYVGRKLYKLLSSTIGMVIILVIYSFIGAALFKLIEGTTELLAKDKVHTAAYDIANAMWNTSIAVKKNELAFKAIMKMELKKYEAALLLAQADGAVGDSNDKVWDFWGSFYYCATVYTTIGYGHIAPATQAGRIATMVYAVLGIPLCLITMTDLGKLLTKLIKFLWAFVRRAWYTGRCLKAKYIRPSDSEGSIEPQEPYAVDERFDLPVLVALGVTVAYIFLGALLYCQWEDWTYLEAFYFIFISVSTIGFGDVLPAHPKYFLMSSLYVLMGLSLVAMVINVMMEAMQTRLDKAKNQMADVTRIIGISAEEEEASKQASQNQSATSIQTAAPARNSNTLLSPDYTGNATAGSMMNLRHLGGSSRDVTPRSSKASLTPPTQRGSGNTVNYRGSTGRLN